MPQGRKTSLTIRLTLAERQTLLAWQRATTIRAGVARRARMILLRADGMTITDIARTVGMSRRHVYKWLHRFRQTGLAGLDEKLGWGDHRGPLPPPSAQRDLEVGSRYAARMETWTIPPGSPRARTALVLSLGRLLLASQAQRPDHGRAALCRQT